MNEVTLSIITGVNVLAALVSCGCAVISLRKIGKHEKKERIKKNIIVAMLFVANSRPKAENSKYVSQNEILDYLREKDLEGKDCSTDDIFYYCMELHDEDQVFLKRFGDNLRDFKFTKRAKK